MKLKTPPLPPRSSTSNPATTTAEQTTSSQERWLQTSFRLLSRSFMGLKSEEILYLKMRWLAGLAHSRQSQERDTSSCESRAISGLFHCVADFAVLHAVAEINDQSNDQPHQQPKLCPVRERDNQQA